MYAIARKGTTMLTGVTIVLERIISAAPERVFSALTQPDELARWWTTDLSVTPEAGSLAEFRFNQGAAVRQFELAELIAGERVRWIVQRGPAHWAGTTITWQLTLDQGGTGVVLTQDGFAQVDALYHQTRTEWDYYLDSLKAYLETGKGTPYVKGELDPL
jgi:uncharacterized protein YndB with AHSA1/START domain